MASLAAPCSHDTPSQTKKIVKITYDKFKIYSFDCVEVRCKKAQKCFGHTRILAVSWHCWQDIGPLRASVNTVLYSMHMIYSWLSIESFRFFNGIVRFEASSPTGGRLRRTLTVAQHWIRPIFSPRPPKIRWNKSSYVQESDVFIAIVKSGMHSQTVHICARKGAKPIMDGIAVRWLKSPPICPFRTRTFCLKIKSGTSWNSATPIF